MSIEGSCLVDRALAKAISLVPGRVVQPRLTASRKAGKLCRAVPNFDSIRPYRDEEVPSVVRRLTASAQLRDGIASFLFPRLYRFSSAATRQLTGGLLWYRARKLKTVHDVQMMVGRFIDHMVEDSVDGLSWSGLSTLDRNRPYLFISNHRDITLDSAFLNRVLHEEGFPTCQIAVGDNLFGTPYADDLMRLNRGFLVERSALGSRAIYAALTRTSSYIRHSLESGVSVWIAQREGRAKDGFDRTEPALLKMLALAWRKARLRNKNPAANATSAGRREIAHLDELLEVVDIVPVAISYELDPCDLRKADELFRRDTTGEFTKSADADLSSIVESMRGYKGRVHLHFGAPLTGSYESADEMALGIDRVIVAGLKVYPSNVAALEELHVAKNAEFASATSQTTVIEPEAEASLSYFKARVRQIADSQRPYLLMQYANLLRNRSELGLSAATCSDQQAER